VDEIGAALEAALLGLSGDFVTIVAARRCGLRLLARDSTNAAGDPGQVHVQPPGQRLNRHDGMSIKDIDNEPPNMTWVTRTTLASTKKG
jgi:hypothetical protein